jgi:hypothetical protein
MNDSSKRCTIYHVDGFEDTIWILVHVEDKDAPSDWDTYQSAVVEVSDGVAQCKLFIDSWLTSLWVSKNGEVFVCSMDGDIHLFKDNKWEIMKLGSEYSLNDIWGSGERVYCCGMNGALFELRDNEFSKIDSKIKQDFQKLRGDSEAGLYIIGESGTLYFFDSSDIHQLDSPANLFWMSLLYVSEEEVFLCGEQGAVFKGKGDRWEKMESEDIDYWDMEMYEGTVMIGSEEGGLGKIDGTSIVPVSPNVKTAGLKVIGPKLYSFYLDNLNIYDGLEWKHVDLKLEEAIFKGNS